MFKKPIRKTNVLVSRMSLQNFTVIYENTSGVLKMYTADCGMYRHYYYTNYIVYAQNVCAHAMQKNVDNLCITKYTAFPQVPSPYRQHNMYFPQKLLL